jgi:hypothetical protein
MRKITLLLLAVSFTAVAMAQAPHVPAKKGTQFGEKVKADNAVSPDMLPGMLQDKASVEVKIKGKVVGVCKARGCFLYMNTSSGKMYIKTKDDAFFVPVALNGKTIVVKGTAAKDKDNNKISMEATGILVM